MSTKNDKVSIFCIDHQKEVSLYLTYTGCFTASAKKKIQENKESSSERFNPNIKNKQNNLLCFSLNLLNLWLQETSNNIIKPTLLPAMEDLQSFYRAHTTALIIIIIPQLVNSYLQQMLIKARSILCNYIWRASIVFKGHCFKITPCFWFIDSQY